MTENNQDKTYTSKSKTFVMQTPINWGIVKDCLRDRFLVNETEDEKVVLLEVTLEEKLGMH